MKVKHPTVFLAWVALLLTALSVHADVRNPERTQGLVASPSTGEHVLVTIPGRGKFVSAQINKQGGTNDATFVVLDIDGRNVVNISIAALANFGLTQNNPYGLVLLQSSEDLKSLAIGFSTPLVFKSQLRLAVDVQEADVTQILANVIHGK